jgi:hypothetical protein
MLSLYISFSSHAHAGVKYAQQAVTEAATFKLNQ